MLVLLRKDVNSLKYLWIVKMCQGDLKKKMDVTVRALARMPIRKIR